jgi:hypothetical protein
VGYGPFSLCVIHKEGTGLPYVPYEAQASAVGNIIANDDDDRHTTHALYPKGQQRHLRYSSERPTFY